MERSFQSFIIAAVRHARIEKRRLLADAIADRIADSTPLPVSPLALADQIRLEAIRQGLVPGPAASFVPPAAPWRRAEDRGETASAA